MYNQNQLIDLFKRQKNFKSDYQLAKHWNVDGSTINQLRKGRLRLPLSFCLEIAERGHFDPLEIIIALEYHRAKERYKEPLKNAYYKIAPPKIVERMNASGWGAHRLIRGRRKRT